MNRNIKDIVLCANDISTLDRTSLSLWHFQQLLQPQALVVHNNLSKQELIKQRLSMAEGIIVDENLMIVGLTYEKYTQEKISISHSESNEKEDDQHTLNDPSLEDSIQREDGVLTVNSKVFAIYIKYRCVVCLDASPSALSIDPLTGRLFFDLLCDSLELFITGLLKPMQFGVSNFEPEIYITVMAQGEFVESMCVLVQGFILTKANYMKLLQLVRDRMQLIEDDWAKIAQLQEESPETSPSYQRAQLPLILQNIVFALNSLPNEAAPIMVMITDGVLDLMNVYAYDNLLMQLTRHDIQCHFLRIGGGNDESSSFGFVPDNDLLGFLADSTGGTLLDYNISVQHTIGTTSQNKTPQDIFEGISLMQRDIFVRRSSIQGVGGGLSGPKLPIDDLASIAVGASMSTLPLLRPFRLWREKVHEYCIWVEIDRILEARVREGFQVTKVFLEPEIKQEASSSSTSDAAGLTSNTLSDRKVSLGFLLQWKENVWLEYVVSSTDTPRPLLKGASVKANVSSSKTPQGSSLKSREWHIRMNVIAHVEFLKTFEESSGTAVETTTRGSTTGGTPPYLHDFIRNVQDVDRVLLHLMTATALVSSNVTAASGGIEGYNTFASSSAGASYVAGVSRATSHPVFNIIGELSPVLWHRWFNVERFEVLCVIKDDHFMDIFYRNDVSNVQDSNRYISRQSASKQRGTRQAFNHRVDNNVIRHISAKGDAIFLVNSVDQVMDGILNILQKWSSLKLGKDLYLKFLAEKNTEVSSSTSADTKSRGNATENVSGNSALKRRQRQMNSTISIASSAIRRQKNSQINVSSSGPSETNNPDSSALCFVRVESKTKTLFAIHVAFFSTKTSLRKRILADLKNTIVMGLNQLDLATSTNSGVKNELVTSSALNGTTLSVVLCHRLTTRLLVSYATLLLEENNKVSYDGFRAKKSAGEIASCCGGSELSLRNVFGAYMWHASWKWHLSTQKALLTVMKRLHQARIAAGFWVLDWTLSSDTQGVANNVGEVDEKDGNENEGFFIVHSILYGREILMEDENGNLKTSLVQYAIHRVNAKCLMTSFWMEPTCGVVRKRLKMSDMVDHKDTFHWGLKCAIGHDKSIDEIIASGISDRYREEVMRQQKDHESLTRIDEEQLSMEQEDVRTLLEDESLYVNESDLLLLISEYIYSNDRHLLSCIFTLDTIMNQKERINLPSQLSKGADGVVGSSWRTDAMALTLSSSEMHDPEFTHNAFALQHDVLVPPFSTARLLCTSKRTTDHFLMYLEKVEKCDASQAESATHQITQVSQANVHLYSMLEKTLRGLSDCEIAWTDLNGEEVGSPQASTTVEHAQPLRFSHYQLPLWLKQNIDLNRLWGLTGACHKEMKALSKGRCFAKLLNDSTVVLAFLPSLDTIQVRQKEQSLENSKRHSLAENDASWKMDSSAASLTFFQDAGLVIPSKVPSAKRWGSEQSSEIGLNTKSSHVDVTRVSVSADDIVLYQERRMSFREGYKSWRMGHFQGSKDGKQRFTISSSNQNASTLEDHEFCEHIAREASYGCDFHVLIEKKTFNQIGSIETSMGSGFFQVAFYECSLSRLKSDSNRESSNHASSMLNQLFYRGTTRSTSSIRTTSAAPTHQFANVATTVTTKATTDSSKPSHLRRPSGGSISLTPDISPTSAPTSFSLSPIISAASRQFRKKVKRAHEHNFSRGVYVALRNGDTVQRIDFLQALSSCIEVPMDLDITLLYRMIQAKEVQSSAGDQGKQLVNASDILRKDPNDFLREKLNKCFEKILTDIFQPVNGTNFYYFVGNETPRSTLIDEVTDPEYERNLLMEDANQETNSELLSTDETVNNTVNNSTDSSSMTMEKPNIVKSTTIATSTVTHQEYVNNDDTIQVLQNEMKKHQDRSVQFLSTPTVSVGPMNDTNSSSSSQQSASLPESHDEDVEFNKEVAVATSSFSIPFFFRFECKEVGEGASLKATTSSSASSVGKPNSGTSANTSGSIQRSVSSISFADFNKEASEVSSQIPRASLPGHIASLLSDKNLLEGDTSQIAEWFGKASPSRIALRLITLTLPNEQVFDRAHLQEDPFDLEERKSTLLLPSHAQIFASLPLFQRQVLKNVRTQIREWCSMEILAILRATHRLTSSIGRLVQKLFDELPSDSLTKVKYPLEFVMQANSSSDLSMSPKEIFKREFLNGNKFLSVCQCNNVFFVVSPSVEIQEENTRKKNFEIPFWAYFKMEKNHLELAFHHSIRFESTPTEAQRLNILTRLHLGVQNICKRVNQYLLLLHLHETRSCSQLLLAPTASTTCSPRGGKETTGSFDAREEASCFFWPGQFECELQYSAFFRLHERLAPNIALTTLCTQALEHFQVHNRRYVFVYRDKGGNVFYMKIRICEAPEKNVVVRGIGPRSSGSNFNMYSTKHRISRSNSGGSSSGANLASPLVTSLSSNMGILLEVYGICSASEEVTHELSRLLERKLDEATLLILMKLLVRNAKFQLSLNDMAFIAPPEAEPVQSLNIELPKQFHYALLLLHYVGQTLALAPYIRQVNTIDTTNNLKKTTVSTSTLTDLEHSRNDTTNPSVIHPAFFGMKMMKEHEMDDSNKEDEWNSSILSPMYFSQQQYKSMKEENVQEPREKIIDRMTFVMNLNPDLRISTGFLSKIGKGIAILKIEAIQLHNTESEEPPLDVVKESEDQLNLSMKTSKLSLLLESITNTLHANVEDLAYSSSENMALRFRVWMRGAINTKELVQVLESSLEQALYDYALEHSLRSHRIKLTLQTDQTEERSAEKVPDPLQNAECYANWKSFYLSQRTLLEKANNISSVSVTKLEFSHIIPPWEILHVVYQVRQLFQILPSHFRPELYRYHSSTHKYVAVSSNYEPQYEDSFEKGDNFRIVCRIDSSSSTTTSLNETPSSTLTPANSYSSLASATTVANAPFPTSDSIQSDLSELEVLSSRTSLTSLSFGDHTLGGNSNGTGGSMKELTEADVMLFYTTVPVLGSDISSIYSRTLYYLMEISTEKGMMFYGYNMSNTLVDAILLGLARIFTWSALRERLVCSVSLEKCGLSLATAKGADVVQPRELHVNSGNVIGRISVSLPKDFNATFIEFTKQNLMLFQEHVMHPLSLEGSLYRMIEGTSMARYLRETNIVLTSDVTSLSLLDQQNGPLSRPRARSGASAVTSIGPPELIRDISTQSQRNSTSDISSTEQGLMLDPSSTNVHHSIPSPTKRVPIKPSSQYPMPPHLLGSGSNPRMRGGANAATALLAARARARGGGSGLGFGGGKRIEPGPFGGGNIAASSTLIGANNTSNTQAANKTSSQQASTEHNTSTVNSSETGAPQEAKESLQGLELSIAASGITNRLNMSVHAPLGLFLNGMQESRSLIQKGRNSSNVSIRDFQNSPLASPASVVSNRRSTSGNSLIGVPESNQTNWRHALQSIVGPHSPYEYIFAKKSCHISCKSPVQDLVKSLQKDFGFYEDHNSYYTAHKKLFHRLFQGIGSPLVDEIEEMDRKLVEDLFKSGHLIFERRFGVTFIDTWDLNYTGQKKGMDSLHALMDLVNLLSYETDFIFTGTEKWIAMLYTEHTIQTMGGEEGKAITQMKQGSLKNLPRLKHQVTKDIYHQYLTHLHELGFQQTKTQITKIREHRTTSKAFIETSEPIEKMCDYFYCNHPNSTSLLLEVRGDFYGIQLTLVSLNEEDLDRWDLEGKNLKKSSALQGNQIAETLSWSKQYLTALSHRLIYEHTIRYFDCQLRDFYLSSGRSLNHQQQQLQETGQHLIKGIRTFIQAFPIPPSTNVSAGSILKTLQVELTSAHRLDSYCPEPVLLKVLLRYIASHAKRYEVCDLMRTGTPDAIFCRSSTGAFFHRTKKNDPTDSKKKTIMPQNQNGDYSLIITTLAVDRSSSFSSSQNKWVNVILIQSKPTATSVTLHDNTRRFLRRGSRPSNGSSSQNDRDRLGFDLGSHNNVLSVEQTLLEAQLFVQELFRVAACHYERDILWSRLLYSTSNVTARVASSLKLSQDHLQMEVGPEQLEECLSLSVCTPFEQLDPTFQNLLTLEGINWSEFALQVCDLYHDQVRQYHFEDGKCFHLLLLCLDARDLMLHLTFSTIENHIEMEICRREEPRNHTFTCEQRHVIGEFVNMLVHWLWRSLLYDP